MPVPGSSSATSTFDYSRRIRERGLGGRQALVILMIGLLVLFDGMDNQLLGLIAHDMSRDLSIPISAFGVVFSSSLAGAIAGALLMSSAADQWLGRRRVAILGMLLAGAGTIVTAYAETLPLLISVRFLTGVGLGAALPILVSLASEFSPQRHSRLVVSLMIAFVPLGSLLGSFMARAILPQADWHTLLHAAGATTLVLALGAAVIVPESVYFLVHRKRDQRRAASAVRKLFPVSGIGAVTVDEDPAERSKSNKQPVARLFSAGLWKLTILFWIAFFMDQAILYFVMNWTPALLLRSGMSSTVGIDAAAMFGLGGAIGTIAQGWLTTRYGIYKVMLVEILLYIAAMLTLPAVLAHPQMAPALVFVIAATICAYHAGLINLILESFPEAIKGTAFGWAFGVGRIGAAGAPVLAGLLLGIGWTPGFIFVGAAALGMMTGLALFGVRRVLSRRATTEPSASDAAAVRAA